MWICWCETSAHCIGALIRMHKNSLDIRMSVILIILWTFKKVVCSWKWIFLWRNRDTIKINQSINDGYQFTGLGGGGVDNIQLSKLPRFALYEKFVSSRLCVWSGSEIKLAFTLNVSEYFKMRGQIICTRHFLRVQKYWSKYWISICLFSVVCNHPINS